MSESPNASVRLPLYLWGICSVVLVGLANSFVASRDARIATVEQLAEVSREDRAKIHLDLKGLEFTTDSNRASISTIAAAERDCESRLTKIESGIERINDESVRRVLDTKSDKQETHR